MKLLELIKHDFNEPALGRHLTNIIPKLKDTIKQRLLNENDLQDTF